MRHISSSNMRLKQLLCARHRTERRFDLEREKSASEQHSSVPAAHPQTSVMSFKRATTRAACWSLYHWTSATRRAAVIVLGLGLASFNTEH